MDFPNLIFNIITLIITIIVFIVAIVYISKHESNIDSNLKEIETNKKNIKTNKDNIEANKTAISQIPTYTLKKLIDELSDDDIASLLINVDSDKINNGMDKLTKDEFLKFKENIDKINDHLTITYEKHIKVDDNKADNKVEDKADNKTDNKTDENNDDNKNTENTENFTLMYPANSPYIHKVNYLI